MQNELGSNDKQTEYYETNLESLTAVGKPSSEMAAHRKGAVDSVPLCADCHESFLASVSSV